MINISLKKAGITLASAAVILGTLVFGTGISTPSVASQVETKTSTSQARHQTQHHTINVDGVDIFYREAGPVDAPTILLLSDIHYLS